MKVSFSVLFYFLSILILLFSSSCTQERGLGRDRPTLMNEICETGEIIIYTRNAPTTYYEGREGPDGFEYQLAELFAESLGVHATYRMSDSVEDILSAVKNGEGHIGAAGITRTEAREKIYVFGPDYKTVEQQVVCNPKVTLPKNKSELKNVSLLIVQGTSYVENMKRITQEISDISWETTSELSTEQILERVWQCKVGCTLADSNIVAINRRYYPELKVAISVSDTQYLAWVLPENANDLERALQEWFNQVQSNSILASVDERFYGHVEIFDYFDIRTYKRRIKKRLPKYQSYFKEAGAKYQIPWTVIAAQAYQESHWNPHAKSMTGVRGIMMLTQTTAKHLGVKSRMDPRESIDGGTKYLSQIIERIPETVKNTDRLWFALAAYNVGIGHLWDARTLTRQLGMNPDLWLDVKTVFPKLSQKKYYKNLRYGYARGMEPVRYVERIRNYMEILEKELHLEGRVRECT